MARLRVKSFRQPDEKRRFADKGYMEILNLGDTTVGRAVFEPGWKWSEHIKPIAGTDSCRVAHCAYVISGSMRVRMDDGDEAEVGPGDLMVIPPGHDAWVTSSEPCVVVDFAGSPHYAEATREPAENAPGFA